MNGEAAREPRDLSRDLLVLHFLLCSVGLARIVSHLALAAFQEWYLAAPQTAYFDWARAFFFPTKPYQLFFYGFTTAAFSLYFTALFLGMPRIEAYGRTLFGFLESRRTRWAWYAAALLLGNLVVALWTSEVFSLGSVVVIKSAVWTALLLMPAWLPWRPLLARLEAVPNRWLGALAVVIAAQTAWMFVPFLGRPVQVVNEYFDLPQQTRLGGRFVDNTAFINERRLFGWTKYDPAVHRDRAPVPPAGAYVRLPRAELPKPERLDYFLARNGADYRYDPNLEALVLSRPMTLEEWDELRQVAGPGPARERIDALWFSSRAEARAADERLVLDEEADFFRKNVLDWTLQMGGFILHHHDFVLGPISELALGKPSALVQTQYGLLSTVVLKSLLEATGGINFQTYFKVLYSFYPLYYGLFLALAWFLLRDLRYVVLSALFVFGSLQLLGHVNMLLAPGFNPIRHFWDLALTALVFAHARAARRLWLVSGALLVLLALFWSMEFGLFLAASWWVASAARVLDDRKTGRAADLVFLAAAGAGILWIHLRGAAGRNPMAGYYLEGIGGVSVLSSVLLFVVAAASLVYAAILLLDNSKEELKYVLVFLFLYCQACLVYYVWNAAPNHFLSLASIVVLPAVILLKLAIEGTRAKAHESALLSILIAASSVFFYAPTLAAYYRDRLDYERLFSDHKAYSWDMERARIESTGDPAYVRESVRQIREHSGAGAAIHILSKYDNILPFLAGKYSAMPFRDVSWSLVTAREVTRCVEAVRRDRPDYLFVDADLGRDLASEVFADQGPLAVGGHKESLMRIGRLGELRKVFDAVRGDYIAVDRGPLLTVYRRRGAPAP